MFDKKRSSSPVAASCGSWCSRDGVSLVAVANLGSASPTMAAAPNSFVSLQKVLEECELTMRPSAVTRTETFISFYLNLNGASTMLYVGISPCHASCKMRGSCRSIRICKMMLLIETESRCMKSMPKMAHAPDMVRTVSRNSCLFKVIRSASFQLPSLSLL